MKEDEVVKLSNKEFDEFCKRHGGLETLIDDISNNKHILRLIAQNMFMKGFNNGLEYSTEVVKK